ncbi:MAG: septum formation protein Maf [Nitrospina sp.]|nr:septum formation protein Maf [Nitrospina sp.]
MTQDPHTRLILASQSPRRRDLLEEAGVPFDVLPADIEEVTDPGLSPADNVTALAAAKARRVAEDRPGRFVLGADTIVVLDNEILGKPRDREDARAMLSRLAGNTHHVITGFAIVTPEGRVLTEAVTSSVTMKPVTAATIETYLDTGEPMDKAGAYAIQGQGNALIAGYEGSYHNIVGLPVEEVLTQLRGAGLSIA